jgi:hypothetical protein
VLLTNCCSVAVSNMQPSLYPNQSLDDVYRQLRDSTDNLANVFGSTVAAAAPDAGAYAVHATH